MINITLTLNLALLLVVNQGEEALSLEVMRVSASLEKWAGPDGTGLAKLAEDEFEARSAP